MKKTILISMLVIGFYSGARTSTQSPMEYPDPDLFPPCEFHVPEMKEVSKVHLAPVGWVPITRTLNPFFNWGLTPSSPIVPVVGLPNPFALSEASFPVEEKVPPPLDSSPTNPVNPPERTD